MKVLICDIDNTLYDFVGFFAPSFRAMIHALSREMDLSEDTLIKDYKQVYQDAGSLEYRFSTQNLPLVKGINNNEDRRRLQELAEIVFGRVRRKRLRPYGGVRSTIKAAKSESVQLVVCTNAPSYLALRRLYQLGLLSDFSHVLAWSGFEQEGEGEKRKERELISWFQGKGGHVHTFEEDRTKPCGTMFQTIKELYGPQCDFFAIGDSIQKDLLPAHRELAATTIWAKYGTQINPLDVATLDQIVPWSDAQKQTHYENEIDFSPDYVVEQFDELLDILNVPVQLPLI